jgi:hypothetical protein
MAMAADEPTARVLTEEERRWRADVLEQLHRLNVGLELLNRTSEQLADVSGFRGVLRAPPFHRCAHSTPISENVVDQRTTMLMI